MRRTLQALIDADNAGDAGAIGQLYAVDAVLITPDGQEVVGRTAIQERYWTGFDLFALEVSLESDETRVSGDLAFDRGTTSGQFVWRDGRRPTPFTDKYLMIFRRQPDAPWKIALLMWNHVSVDGRQ